jgi:hypothetical protein
MMKKKTIVMPKFVNEAQEADWWASREGREFAKPNAAGTGKKAGAPTGSCLVGRLNKVPSVQIALRLPEPDVTKARELATRKDIGYQTLFKMLVHEGLRREARRTRRVRYGLPLGRGVATRGPNRYSGSRWARVFGDHIWSGVWSLDAHHVRTIR